MPWPESCCPASLARQPGSPRSAGCASQRGQTDPAASLCQERCPAWRAGAAVRAPLQTAIGSMGRMLIAAPVCTDGERCCNRSVLHQGLGLPGGLFLSLNQAHGLLLCPWGSLPAPCLPLGLRLPSTAFANPLEARTVSLRPALAGRGLELGKGQHVPLTSCLNAVAFLRALGSHWPEPAPGSLQPGQGTCSSPAG